MPKKKIIPTSRTNFGFIFRFKEEGGFAKPLKSSLTKFAKFFPKEKDSHFFHHTYTTVLRGVGSRLSTYADLYEYFDISASMSRRLATHAIYLMDPQRNSTIELFNKTKKYILKDVVVADVEIIARLKKLNKIECIRLYEAMQTLHVGCHLSSVVMAVSAVEHRFHKLLSKSNPRLYSSEFERATLGSIIELFRKDSRYKDPKYKNFKALLPDKHKPLMEMLNIYRIFSAHPKDEIISYQTAKAIISLSFLLLIDESLSI